MLETVTIQNFRSLKDVTLKLQKVNLLIGPNNSGKSNFLKALAFLKEHFNNRIQPPLVNLNRLCFNQKINNKDILFDFRWQSTNPTKRNSVYHLELLGYNKNDKLEYNELSGIYLKPFLSELKITQIDDWVKGLKRFKMLFEENISYANYDGKIAEIKSILESEDDFPDSLSISSRAGEIIVKGESLESSYSLKKYLRGTIYLPFDLEIAFNSIKIYKPDPSRIMKENLLLFDTQVNEDCSNLVAFLDNMRDGHEDVWQAIQKDLNKCIPDFTGINFEKVKVQNSENVGKRFGLRDKFGKTFWAEELSEGTIYFLAILAIIHQPNPPRILLLEEPEKGIHPRRIAEVMDLIFRLANEKDIQIILTSHSTQVVDEFQDIPESVFVFETNEGETKVKNLLTDIIEPDNKNAIDKSYPKLDFSKHSLGEHWAIGFFGGVPTK